jgi:hypothetical protein
MFAGKNFGVLAAAALAVEVRSETLTRAYADTSFSIARVAIRGFSSRCGIPIVGLSLPGNERLQGSTFSQLTK